jgi:hypothetical protein
VHEEGRKEGRKKRFSFLFSFGIEWREKLTKSVGLARNWRTRSVAECDGIGTKLPRTSFSCFRLTQRPHPYCDWNLLHLLCFFPVQNPQSKKLAFRILTLRSPQKHHWEAPNPNEEKKTAAVATAEFELQRDVAKLFICRLLLPSRALRCRERCRRGRRTGIRYGSPVTTGAVSSGIPYDRSETAEAAAPAQYFIIFNNEIKWTEKHN